MKLQESSLELSPGFGEAPKGSKTAPGMPKRAPKTGWKNIETFQEGHQWRQEPLKTPLRGSEEAPKRLPERVRSIIRIIGFTSVKRTFSIFRKPLVGSKGCAQDVSQSRRDASDDFQSGQE